MDFLHTCTQSLCAFRYLLYPELQLLLNFKRIIPNNLILLYDINIRIYYLIEHIHESINRIQIQTTTR
jgi:hypothetical protein